MRSLIENIGKLFLLIILSSNSLSAQLWNQTDQDFASTGATGSFTGSKTGWSVAINDDFAFAGSPYTTGPSGQQMGFVTVYESMGGGVWNETQVLQSSDNNDEDLFGCSMDVDGDRLIVGAYTHDYSGNVPGGGSYVPSSGAAYIFKNIGGVWTEEQKITGDLRWSSRQFGNNVSISGNYVAVGCRGNFNANLEPPVYIYKNDGTGNWTQTAKIVDPFPGIGVNEHYFSSDIKLNGEDELFVTSRLDPFDELQANSMTDAGAVYVYHRDCNDNWYLSQKIVHPSRQIGGKFGSKVTSFGDNLAIGAYGHGNDGSIVFYEKNASGIWVYKNEFAPNITDNNRQHLVQPDRHSLDMFGDYLVAGTGQSYNPASNQPAKTYVLEKQANGTWNQYQTPLQQTNGVPADAFGEGVAIHCNKIIVGAPRMTLSTLATDNSGGFQGTVTIFEDGPTMNISDTISINPGDSTMIAGVYYNTPGSYANGCITTELIYTPIPNDTITICDGDSVLIGGIYQSIPGTYTDSLTNIHGCDSLVSTTLVTNTQINNFVTLSICQGDSVLLAGGFQTIAGIYVDSLQSAGGCDSIVQTTLTVNSVIIVPVDITICQGDSVLLGGGFQSIAGVYADSLQAAGGCDSIVQTTLTVNSIIIVPVDITICEGDSLFLAGSYQSFAGIYNDTLSNISGCDSIIATTLSIDGCFEPEPTNPTIVIPNVFTPNGDGVNEIFTITGSFIESYDINIMNRWGQLLYSTMDFPGGWDGRTVSGIDCPEGTYYYVVKFNYYQVGVLVEEVRDGFLTLLR